MTLIVICNVDSIELDLDAIISSVRIIGTITALGFRAIVFKVGSTELPH